MVVQGPHAEPQLHRQFHLTGSMGTLDDPEVETVEIETIREGIPPACTQPTFRHQLLCGLDGGWE